MKKREIAQKLARKTGVTEAEAADQLDHTINEILRKLRAGESADLAGIGQFRRNAIGAVEFRKSEDQ